MNRAEKKRRKKRRLSEILTIVFGILAMFMVSLLIGVSGLYLYCRHLEKTKAEEMATAATTASTDAAMESTATESAVTESAGPDSTVNRTTEPVEMSEELKQAVQTGVFHNITFDGNCLDTNSDFFSYEDDANQIMAVPGVDASSWQGEIDWDSVWNEGADFAFIRLGGRGSQTHELVLDDNFEENIEGAQTAGLKVGVYFYSNAQNTQEAIEEAQFVQDNLKGVSLDYPVVYDYEYNPNDENGTEMNAGLDVTANAIAFCEAICGAGYQPMIYMSDQMLYGFYRVEDLGDIPIWYASYTDSPTFNCRLAMWQYSNGGSFSGVPDAPIDIDLMFVNNT